MKVNMFKTIPTWTVGLFIMVLFIVNAAFNKKPFMTDQLVRTYWLTSELKTDADDLEGRGYHIKAIGGNADDKFVVVYEKIK